MASNISKLPDECLVMIFEYLTLEQQLACLWVSEKWRNLVENFILKRMEEIKLPASYVSRRAEVWKRYIVTREGFEHVVRLCGENLRSLDLTELSCLDNVQELRLVDVLSTYCKQLDTLKLSSPLNTYEFNRLLVRLGPNLKTLKICNDQLTSTEISTLFSNCKNLDNFSISFSYELTSDVFINTPRSLKEINIVGCSSFSNKCLEYVLNSCQNTLEVLDATLCSGFTAGYLNFISQFNNLKVFSLSRSSTFGCGILGNLTKLEELRLVGGRVEAYDLSAIVNGCKRLRILDVTGSGLTPQGFACLGEAKALEDLNVSFQPSFNDESLQIVAKLPHLTHLRLRMCRSVSCDGVKAMAPLASHLEYIDLYAIGLIDDMKVLEAFDSSLPKRKIIIDLWGTRLGNSLRGISKEQRPKYDNVEWQ